MASYLDNFSSVWNPQNQNNGKGMNIQTAWQPQQVYPDEYTRAAQNWADSSATPSWGNYLQKAQQQGVSSRSPSVQYNTGVDLASALAGAMYAPSQIGMQQGYENAQNMLTGQIGRSNEALGWGQIGAQSLANQLGLNQSQNEALIDFMRRLLGTESYF